jgi:hypothetical protein
LLDSVHEHRTVYIARQVLWLAPNIFLMVVFLAPAAVMRRQSQSLAAVAGVIGVSSWAVGLAWPTTGDGSPARVVLSDRYAEATTAAERASYAAGAEVMSALNDVPAAVGVTQTLGVLLIGLLMLRGTFGKGLAWLGVATGAIGIASEALRPILGWAYAGYGLLLFSWLAGVAVALWRLAGTPSMRRSRPSTAVGVAVAVSGRVVGCRHGQMPRRAGGWA